MKITKEQAQRIELAVARALKHEDIVWLNAQCEIVEFTANEKTEEA